MKPGNRKPNIQLKAFVVVLSLTIVALFYVWTRLQNIRLRLDQSRLKSTEREVLLENNRLKLEWAKLTSPKRLEQLGAEKYNLRRPLPEQVIVVTDSKK